MAVQNNNSISQSSGLQLTLLPAVSNQTIMPRGLKSKIHACQKCHQDDDVAPGFMDAHTSATESGESPSHSAQTSGAAVLSTSTAAYLQKSQGAVPITTAYTGNAQKWFGEGAKRLVEERASSHSSAQKNRLLKRKKEILMEYMLCKYKMKQPMLKGEMVNVINKRFKEQFPDILKKASQHLDMVFGLELKEIKPIGKSYMIVNKSEFQADGNTSSHLGFPTTRLVIPVLSVIYLHGSCAAEADIWHFLNMLGVHDGTLHLLFGDAKKLITRDLVIERYLEYWQMPNSDPPSYKFLWGPRAYSENCIMRVLEFLDKINQSDSFDYLSHNEGSLMEDRVKAQAEDTAGPGKTKGRSKANSTLTTQ